MSDANLTNKVEVSFLPSDEMLKRYKEIVPSLAEPLEKVVQEARTLSYSKEHSAFTLWLETREHMLAIPCKSAFITSEKIVYMAAALTLMAPFAVLVSILYLIFSK